MQINRPIAIVVTIFIIIFLVYFFVLPEYNSFTSLQNELGVKEAQYVGQHDYYDSIDALYYNLQSQQANISKIDDALPQNSSLGQVVYFLQQTAKNNGLVVKNLFLSQSSSGSTGEVAANSSAPTTLKNIVFSIDLSGDYPSLEGFLSSLENSSRLFEITTISFSSASGPPYSFSLQIKTYSY